MDIKEEYKSIYKNLRDTLNMNRDELPIIYLHLAILISIDQRLKQLVEK